jgi:membrane protease subunit HflK
MARTGASEERRVGRLLSRLLLVVALVGLLGSWAWFGFYRLNPGEAAVILRLGKYRSTEVREGLRWHLPPPVESRAIVNVGLVAREQFGDIDTAREAATLTETAMQTGDNNIVDLEFVVKYKVGNLRETLRDSAQAAMREVVGRNGVDDVLSEKRGVIQDEAAELLQQILDRYESGLHVEGIELQEVEPPASVRDAFDDVIAAAQDRNRKVNEAEGYANEVLPRARAEAAEVVEASIGYRDAKIAEANGEAQRFLSILREYEKAPEITRKRLYLETMEEVLPGVEKVIIEPGAASVVPYLPLGAARKEPRP